MNHEVDCLSAIFGICRSTQPTRLQSPVGFDRFYTTVNVDDTEYKYDGPFLTFLYGRRHINDIF